MLVDKEAFEGSGQRNGTFIMKQFWNSANNKIIIARKADTKSIVGYALFAVQDPKDARFGKNKRLNSIYLLRIAVRVNSQGQGIGQSLMGHLLKTYGDLPISLDVSTDNLNAIKFY